MKRLIIILALCCIALSGCAKAEASPNKSGADGIAVDMEVKEKMFVTQINEIYLNIDDYIGKTIKLEGMFTAGEYGGAEYYIVYRSCPGCCGPDGQAGFEVVWSDARDYPAENDWVEAVGVLEFYEENGYEYARLNLLSLTVLADRGAEYVER